MIKQNSIFRNCWDVFIVGLVLISCIFIPFQISFQRHISETGSVIVYIVDFLFFIDIFLNFITSFRSQGTEFTAIKRTATRYLRTFFLIDLLATLPIDALFLGSRDILVYNISIVLALRLLRLLRIVRLYVIINRWEVLSRINPGVLRITKFLTTITLLIHWIACAWFLSAYIDDFPENCWVTVAGIKNADPGVQYIRSLYWTISSMTTVGYGDITPNRAIEYVFSIIVMLLGASMYAFIIGNIASLFSNLDAAKVSFWNRTESVIKYLRDRQVPFELTNKIRNYYEYMWASHRGSGEDYLFNDLPQPLRLEILEHVAHELLAKVPLLSNCSETLRHVLLMALKPKTYAPDGYIVRAGETGDRIFFLSKGNAVVISEDGTEYDTLEEGDYFGIMSLILGEKRTASVKSLTYCEMFELSDHDFLRLKRDFTEFKDVLKIVSSKHTNKTSTYVGEGIIL